ncbi:MAG: hypothetical protein VYE22_41040 [Myxococcota bacterium]|nr:hypothetical protein [Myxococcota bacterium]
MPRHRSSLPPPEDPSAERRFRVLSALTRALDGTDGIPRTEATSAARAELREAYRRLTRPADGHLDELEAALERYREAVS